MKKPRRSGAELHEVSAEEATSTPDPVGGTRDTVPKERHVIHKTKKPRWTGAKMFCSSWRSQMHRVPAAASRDAAALMTAGFGSDRIDCRWDIADEIASAS